MYMHLNGELEPEGMSSLLCFFHIYNKNMDTFQWMYNLVCFFF